VTPQPVRLPSVTYAGRTYTRVSSGNNVGRYRCTSGARDSLQRDAWRASGKKIPRGFVIVNHRRDYTTTNLDDLECVPKEDVASATLARATTPKRCLACGELFGRRYGARYRETSVQFRRRKTCGMKCQGLWKQGRPRGGRMP